MNNDLYKRLSTIPRHELEKRLIKALKMMCKIAGEKQAWSIGELDSVICDITREYKRADVKRSRVPNFVFSNLERMFTERVRRGFLLSDIRKLTGISSITLENYEDRQYRPGRKNYNKLAKIFGWEEWL